MILGYAIAFVAGAFCALAAYHFGYVAKLERGVAYAKRYTEGLRADLERMGL